MKKKLGFALLFAALVLCLSGCRSSYTRSEVRTYTWKLLHYSPFFTLSQESVPVVGEDSYTDQVWTVRTWGKNPLEFRVVESHGWNMEWASVGLVTDYADALILQEAEKFEGLQDITLDTSWKEGRLYTYLNAEFSTREELNTIMEELTEFSHHLRKRCNFSRLESFARPYYRPMQLSLKLDWPNYYGTYDETYGLRFSELEPEALSQLYSDFLRYAVEYRHPFKDDFTREEICTAVAKKGVHQIGISRFYPDGPYLYYNDLCNVTDKKSLCYRTLYEIMVREEALFGISDTEDHFFFMDMLGRNCEFSCQFFDLDEDGHPRYYHLADGEKIYDGRRPRIDIDDEFTLLTGFYLRHS